MTPHIFRTARPKGLERPRRSRPAAVLAASLGTTMLGMALLSAASDVAATEASESHSHPATLAVSLVGWPNITWD